MLIAVTRLRLRSVRFFLPFMWYAVRSGRQARGWPGNCGASFRRSRGLTFWTVTAWQEEAALNATASRRPIGKRCRGSWAGAMRQRWPAGSKRTPRCRPGRKQPLGSALAVGCRRFTTHRPISKRGESRLPDRRRQSLAESGFLGLERPAACHRWRCS